MAEIVEAFGPHTKMTVQECLEYCARTHEEFDAVIVIGYDRDGDLVVRSSGMTRRDANWMIDAAKVHVWNND